MGDALDASEQALYNFNTLAVHTAFLSTVVNNQGVDGDVPVVIPALQKQQDKLSWAPPLPPPRASFTHACPTYPPQKTFLAEAESHQFVLIRRLRPPVCADPPSTSTLPPALSSLPFAVWALLGRSLSDDCSQFYVCYLCVL